MILDLFQREIRFVPMWNWICSNVKLDLFQYEIGFVPMWTDRKRKKKKNVMSQMSCVRCPVSHLTCPISPVTCQLSPVNNANSHSHRPSPCKLPTMNNRLVWKDPTKQKKCFSKRKKILKPQNIKMSKDMPFYLIVKFLKIKIGSFVAILT